MDDKLFQRQLDNLIVEIGDLPKDEQGKLMKLAEETKTRHQNMQKTFSAIQETIDFLRLSIKYVVFDLEATRRENECLRRLLDESRNEHD